MDYELYGIPMVGFTPTHGPCQVEHCLIEWTVARTVGDGLEARDVSLCSKHSSLFRDLEEVGQGTLRTYRNELENANEAKEEDNQHAHPR